MAPSKMPLTHEIDFRVTVNSPMVGNLWLFNGHCISVCAEAHKNN